MKIKVELRNIMLYLCIINNERREDTFQKVLRAIEGGDELQVHSAAAIESLGLTATNMEDSLKEKGKLWSALPKIVSKKHTEHIVNANVKCLRAVGSVTVQTLQEQMRNPGHCSEMWVKEIGKKMEWMLRKAGYYLIKGDSKIVPEEWNGIYAQHASAYSSPDAYMGSDVVIDLRGEELTQEWIEKGAAVVGKHGGKANCVWVPLSVASSLFLRVYYQCNDTCFGPPSYLQQKKLNVYRQYIINPSFGKVLLRGDICLNKPEAKQLSDRGTSHRLGPTPPDATAQDTVRDPDSKFVDGEAQGALGTVFYAVSAVNRYGESTLAPFSNTKKLTLAAGSSAVLTFAATPSINPATGFIIYRSEVTSETDAEKVKFFPIFRVSATELANGYDGAPPGQVYDRNRFLPNTEEAFITEMSEEVLYFKQLESISKVDIPTRAPSNEFLMFVRGTPVLRCPKKLVRFINIGHKN